MSEIPRPLALAPEESTSNTNTDSSSSQANCHTNGVAGKPASGVTPTHRFDPNYTQNVINATGPKASPRIRKVVHSLMQHIHDFARENELTVDEWMAGVEFVRP